MNDEEISNNFDNLKNKQLSDYYVKKDDFLKVRKILVNRNDFKHFRGTALRGGDVVYQYLDDPRS